MTERTSKAQKWPPTELTNNDVKYSLVIALQENNNKKMCMTLPIWMTLGQRSWPIKKYKKAAIRKLYNQKEIPTSQTEGWEKNKMTLMT